MTYKKLFFLYGFFLGFLPLVSLTGSPYVGYFFQVIIFAILLFLIFYNKFGDFKLPIVSSIFSICFSIYILIIVASGIYFFNGDRLKWIVGLFPYLFTIPLFIGVFHFSKVKKIEMYSNLWKGLVFGSMPILIIALLFGQYDHNSRLHFMNISYSVIGRNGIIVIVYFLSQLFFRKSKLRIWNFMFLFFGVIMIILAGSKSSIVAFILILFFLLFRLKLLSFKRIIQFGLFFLVIFFTAAFDTFYSGMKTYTEGGHAETLSGRIFIWVPLLELIEKRFYFGYGYNAPSALLTAKYFNIWDGEDIIQAHNAWLQSMLNVGFLGTLFLFFVYMLLFKNLKTVRMNDKQLYFIVFFIASFLFIRGFTEASFTNGSSSDVYWFSIVVMQTVSLSNRK